MAAEQSTPTITIQLPPLTPTMKAAFVPFYEDTVNGVEPASGTFDEAAFGFFDEKGTDPGAVDEFFNAFTPLWTHRLAVGAWGPAANVWTWALRPALAWESGRAQRLHKGTAFYFSAMTAILAGDIDGGYLYAHRGLEEDRLTHGVVTPATPSLSLVAMDSDNVSQAFRPWVLEKAKFVNASLVAYQQGSGRALDFRGLRAKLLERVDCIEPTFLFSYCVARLRRLDSMMPGGSDSDFASQLRLNVLFDLTLVTDDVLRRLAPGKWKFIDLAVALASRVSMTLDKAALRAVNGDFENDFNATVTTILDGVYALPDGRKLAGLEKDLALTYGCRNRGAHHLSGGVVINSRFNEVRQSLMNTLFLAVELMPV
jgi:hypothetical protein